MYIYIYIYTHTQTRRRRHRHTGRGGARRVMQLSLGQGSFMVNPSSTPAPPAVPRSDVAVPVSRGLGLTRYIDIYSISIHIYLSIYPSI